MANILLNPSICTGCGCCAAVCPFQAVKLPDRLPEFDAGCTLCGECIRSCPTDALSIQSAVTSTATGDWKGILIFLQLTTSGIHPVSRELLAQGNRMAAELRCQVYGVVVTDQAPAAALLDTLPLHRVLYYTHSSYRCYDAQQVAQAVAGAVGLLRPAILLVGATAEGRAMAPYVAVRFQTGLTADCTALKINEQGKLVQIRPAFGGNLMAQILTPFAYPQIATVRAGIFSAELAPVVQSPQVDIFTAPPTPSQIVLQGQSALAHTSSLTDAKLLVAIGRGIKRKEDIPIFEELATSLGGELAASRTLVELGWMPPERQIGLSGWSVRPELLLTLGISGSIQFRAGIGGVSYLCSVNNDPDAPIHACSNLPLVCDLYEFAEALQSYHMHRDAILQ